MKKIKLFPLAALLAASALTFTVTSCGEETPDDDNTSGGYTTSDEVASANLVAKFSFENNVDDAKGNITHQQVVSIEATSDKPFPVTRSGIEVPELAVIAQQ